MSPQSLRESSESSPASGDVAESGGRHRRPESHRPESHRRPESLADSQGQPFRVSTLLESDDWIPGPRSARHRRPASPAGHPAAGHARRSAAHRAAPTRPPVTGSHRAPGTLPIESWLLMGKKRQQALLASLVAVGLLLVAVPGARGRDGIDAVNAAARATGIHTPQKNKATGDNDQSGKDVPARATPAPSGTADNAPVPEVTATVRPAGKNPGPGHSLRITGSTAVALTFDDGPDPEQTPRILALLEQYQIKATFCLVGRQVEKHPEVVRQIVAAGHTLCNHTWNHSLTIGKDKPEQIQADLARTSAAIRAAVPDAKIPFFRAPGGNFTDRLVGVAAAGGMTSLYWQVDPQDWDHKTGETDAAHITRVIAEVKKHVRPGSIVLSHDFNQPDTIVAYAKLLPWLHDNFALGIPGEPAPSHTTPPATEPTPTPTETPAFPNPSASTTPAAVAGDEDADA